MKKSLLIFDDDEAILALSKAILNRFDYEVGCKLTCDNVIQDIQEFKPDLILMDLWIPQIGGEKAVMLIKHHPEYKNIPIILFSANANVKEISQNLHVAGYIEKPFEIERFINIIQYHLSN